MLRFLSKSLLGIFILGTLLIVLATLYIVPDLPDIDILRDVRMQVPLRVYSHDGSLIAEFGEKRSVPVTIGDAPPGLLQAFIAAEDDRFYAHPGVDWQGILRAAFALIRTGERRQGGSTITMQVARNFFLSRERSYVRKLNEIFLALKIERELTKDQILELYINKIYLGQRAYGAGAAAQVYYGSALSDLNLAQLAMIAGLPKAPSTTNPVSDPVKAGERRAYVLRRMLEVGFIDQAEFERADSAPITASLHRPDIDLEAPYIAEMVRKQLTDEYGDEAYTAGYNITTTIRDKNQIAANHAIRIALLQYDERHGYRGAEHHYDLKGPAEEAQWKQSLAPHSAIGQLFPAIITRVRERSVSAYLSGIGPIDIEWGGLKWARQYIDENLRGPKPETADQILKVGDIVRVRENEQGEWQLSQIPAVDGGLVSLDPDNGATLALVGGLDFYRSKFNRITQAERQPGSSFKPFIYSAAMEHGFNPASIINDAPVVYNDPGLGNRWRPKNYSGKTFGPTRLRVALRKSRNLVSIRLLHELGVQTTLKHIAKFGFDTDELPRNLSLALGSGAVTPWRLAGAYTVFANGGYRVEPHFIERIETYDGKLVFAADPVTVCGECPMAREKQADGVTEEGESIETDGREKVSAIPEDKKIAPGVVAPDNIWIMNNLTRDVVRRGTGVRAYRELKRDDLSGKTGTTNEQRDAWFAGFNADVVAVAWVGFDNFGPLGSREVGGRAALPMWIEYMRIALEGTSRSMLERPAGIVNIRINRETGCPTSADDKDAMFEVFMADRLPDPIACEEDDPAPLF